jgi:hypothetical protein
MAVRVKQFGKVHVRSLTLDLKYLYHLVTDNATLQVDTQDIDDLIAALQYIKTQSEADALQSQRQEIVNLIGNIDYNTQSNIQSILQCVDMLVECTRHELEEVEEDAELITAGLPHF